MENFSNRVRLRFWVEQDLQLLREVAKQNPFENIDRWTQIHENFVNECNIPFSLRSCKDHCNHLLNLYSNNKLKIRPKESRAEFAKKKKYLEEILALRNQFNLDNFFRDSTGSQNSIENQNGELVEKQNLKQEECSDDDFYWNDEDSQLSNDNEANLNNRELAIEERQLALKKQQIQLHEEKLELSKIEVLRRTEMANMERSAFQNATQQNEAIISDLLKKLPKVDNTNLCVL